MKRNEEELKKLVAEKFIYICNTTLPPKDLRYITDEAELVTFNNKEQIKGNPIGEHIYIIVSGVFRYSVRNRYEKQITLRFSYPKDIILPFNAASDESTSITSIGKCVVLKIKVDRILSCLDDPKLFLLALIEKALEKVAQETYSRNLTPEEHYMEIRKKHSDVINLIPSKYLASHIGVSAEYFSRIIKKMSLVKRTYPQ